VTHVVDPLVDEGDRAVAGGRYPGLRKDRRACPQGALADVPSSADRAAGGRERTGLVRRGERQWATGTPSHGLGSRTRRDAEQWPAGTDLSDRGRRGGPRGLGDSRTGDAAPRDPRARRGAGHAPARGPADCGAACGGVGACGRTAGGGAHAVATGPRAADQQPAGRRSPARGRRSGPRTPAVSCGRPATCSGARRGGSGSARPGRGSRARAGNAASRSWRSRPATARRRSSITARRWPRTRESASSAAWRSWRRTSRRRRGRPPRVPRPTAGRTRERSGRAASPRLRAHVPQIRLDSWRQESGHGSAGIPLAPKPGGTR
jgi:hypothetical protein